MAKPTETIHALVAAGVTHVIGLPDNTSGPLFDALARHPTVRLVMVTREGEAPAIATGLWMGGAAPLVLIQNTGLLECGDALRGTAVRVGAPIPIVITGRGYTKMARAGIDPHVERTRELLTRADIDSVALLTEPTLAAWGIPFTRCAGDDDPVAALHATVDDARERGQPVALVLARELV
jgi:sulfopyruvate decarboxylase TPP-binding subunit